MSMIVLGYKYFSYVNGNRLPLCKTYREAKKEATAYAKRNTHCLHCGTKLKNPAVIQVVKFIDLRHHEYETRLPSGRIKWVKC